MERRPARGDGLQIGDLSSPVQFLVGEILLVHPLEVEP
jgi:hypothetical protein